jgi:hypothetical protein
MSVTCKICELLIQDYMSLVYNLVITPKLWTGIQFTFKLQVPTIQVHYCMRLLSPFGFTRFSFKYYYFKRKTNIFKTHRMIKDASVLLLTEHLKNLHQFSRDFKSYKRDYNPFLYHEVERF